MIRKQDILERAREWQLRPEVVEKDYVLGWLLAAIAHHEDSSEQWVFKGGTCVKKCFFETYRFSEDLDFSLLPEAAYSEAELRDVLREVTELASEMSGIEFSADALAVRARVDRLGRATFEGKVGYRGPLAVPTRPRVLFDLTQHELVVDEPVLRRVLHPYPDELPAETLVQSYSIEELIAEKTTAARLARWSPTPSAGRNRGNLLLYGWELESNQIKAFDVAKISQLSTTDRTFTPRYHVEFSPGAGSETPILATAPRVRRAVRRPSRVRRGIGPTYVYVCPVCGREFRHQRRDSTLRRHKTGEGGWYCSGRRGHLSRVE